MRKKRWNFKEVKLVMSHRTKYTILIIGAILIFILFFGRVLINPETIGEKVAIIEILGVINDSEETIKQIHQHRDNTSVKAIVLRIDSPGGGVAPVQEIYSELKKLKSKPIFASMGSTAASGGYYIACAAQDIFANPGTLTGSIGAVMQFIKMKELYNKVGIEYQTVKSGKYKDIGASQRDMTQAERDLIQTTVDDVRSQFIKAIAEGRRDRLTWNQIEAFADGRIFTGKQASENMLIDQLGNLQDTVAYAAQAVGIKGKPKITRIEQKPTFLEKLLNLTSSMNQRILPSTSFRYELNFSTQ